MPEAPEVRVVQDYLNQNLPKDPISKIRVFNHKFFEPNTIFQMQQLPGQFLQDITRHGKALFFNFNNQKDINICMAKPNFKNGLGMTGYWYCTYDSGNLNKNCQFELEFGKLRFQYFDPRRFGHFTYNENLIPVGRDIFQCSENNFHSFFYEYVQARTKIISIKEILLRQDLIAGIGNYLANEILWYTKIHPLTFAKDIALSGYEAIVKTAQDLAEKFYEVKGTALRDFQVNGVESKGQELLKIYGQKICSRCNLSFNKFTFKNRPTYYCLNCQKENYHEIK